MGKLLSTAFQTSEERTNNSTLPSEDWLDAAMDGLLTVEGERFMLSLPQSVALNCLATLRPQIINELAELRRFRLHIIKRIEELLKIEFRHGDEGRYESRVRDELSRLKDWFVANGAEAAAAA